MDSESSVAGCYEYRSIGRVPGGTEIRSALQVGEDADSLREVTLSWGRIVSTGHDDRKLSLESELEEPDELANTPLVGFGIHRSGIIRDVEEVHRVWSGLLGKGRGAEGGEDLEDAVIHRGGHGPGVRVIAEAHSKVAIHGGRVKSAWVAVAEGLEGLIVLGAPGEYSSSVINMGVDDHEYVGVYRTGNLELAEVTFELCVP